MMIPIHLPSILFTLFIGISGDRAVPSGTESNLQIRPTQASLIKLGFNGILWDHIKSNRNPMNHLSTECSSKLNHISNRIESDDPEALKLFTSSSHIPNRFFEISYSDLEGYDQCLSMEGTHYCQVAVLPNQRHIYPHWFSQELNHLVHIGFCLPRECTPNEMDNLTTSVIQSYDWEVNRFYGCLRPSSFKNRLIQANTPQLLSLSFLCTLFIIIILSSILDHRGVFNRSNGLNWLKHFSLQQSHRKLNSIKLRDSIFAQRYDQFKVIKLFLTIAFHTLLAIPSAKLNFLIESAIKWKGFNKSWSFQPLFNSDGLTGNLVYAGALTSSARLWPIITKDTPFIEYIKLFIKKYLIYLPVMVVAIAMKIILPLLGSGPVYTYIAQEKSEICSTDWWYTLLHVHNYHKSVDICYIIFWTMDAELHLFIVALILVYLYKTKPRLGYLVNVILIIGGFACVFITYYSNSFIFRIFGIKPEDWDQMTYQFVRTYLPTHIYLFQYSIALMVAFHVHLNPNSPNETPKFLIWPVTILVIVLMLMAAFTPGLWNILKLQTTPFYHALNAATCKFIVACGLAWFNWLAYRGDKHKMTRRSRDVKGTERISTGNQREKPDQRISFWFKLSLAVSKSYYFSHFVYFIWFYANQRKIRINAVLTTNLIYLSATGYLFGVFFYYFAFAPFEGIMNQNLHGRKRISKSE